MKHRITLALACLAIAACAENELSAPERAPSLALARDGNAPGAVYTLTNETSGNAVAIFDRASDGTLSYVGAAPTGGLGTGEGLNSQGAVVLSEDNRFLLAVNAGSDDLSVFAVTSSGLSRVQRIGSGGARPVSVAIRKGIVYVLNAGGSGNIAGFAQAINGELSPIAGSSRPLSAPDAGGAQVSFTTDGKALIVTERLTNVIDVYALNGDGSAQEARVHPSSGATPFGFDFGKRGALIVSEAFGGAPDASAASSYLVGPEGALSLVTGSLGTTETSACWLVVSQDGRFAYVANTGSGTVSGYAIGHDGSLALLDADGVTGPDADGGPADLTLSGDGQFLYVLTRGTNSVTGFERSTSDGDLERTSVAGGLPASAVGLAAR
jgi:6-phosphogluconolactonase (cycloisomerase 2 family)